VKIDMTSLRGLEAHRSADAELAIRLGELEAEADGRTFNDEQRSEFEQIMADRETLKGAIEELELRTAVVEAALPQDRKVERAFVMPNVVRAAEDIFDVSAYRKRVGSVDELPGAYRDGAMRVLEGMHFPTAAKPDAQRDRIASIIEKHRGDEYGVVSRRVIGTSSPLYADAWAAAMKGQPLNGRMLAVLQSYSDGTDGGYALPVSIDPTFVNTSDGEVMPLRQPGWARVETITTKQWSGITTAGVTAAYVGERTTTGASDGAPTDVGNPTATPVRADVSVDVSLEYLQDYGSQALLAEVGSLIQSAKDDLEAVKFFMGSGSSEPDGIVARLITDTTSIVSTDVSDVFDLGDIDKLIGALPPRFRSRAKFTANHAILQLIPAFGVAGQPADSIYSAMSKTLRGYAVAEASAMDDVATDAKEILLFGDFSKFVIVDRLGLTSKVVDSFDGSGRPTGNSSIYAAWRNDSQVLTVNAFRLLKVA
jgi:HK97 family phage major capsid protein